MSDIEQNNEELKRELAEPGVDQTRRRLTGAVVGSGVILTLKSHPVLAGGGSYGGGTNECTKSSILSGNLSKPDSGAQCGCSPGYWGQHPGVWGGLTENLYLPNMVFNTVFGRTVFNNGATLGQVAIESLRLGLVTIPSDCNRNSYYSNVRNASFHAVAALLNSATFAWRFLPLYDTPAKVITAYQAAFDNSLMNDNCGSALNELKNQWDKYSNLYCGYAAQGNYE